MTMETTTNHSSVSETDGGLRGYLTGFLLALALTLIPFFMVMRGGFATTTLVVAIFAAAIVQILVHLRYFLHLHFSYKQRWDIFTFVFTAVVVCILVGGSVWIMHSLHTLLH